MSTDLAQLRKSHRTAFAAYLSALNARTKAAEKLAAADARLATAKSFFQQLVNEDANLPGGNGGTS